MATNVNYDKLKDEYKHLWDTMTIRDNWKRVINTAAERILAHKAKYQEVSNLTHVPWFWIGAIHNMESSCDWKSHLHNGDSLNNKTYHVPVGRPIKGSPPFTWVESAEDALEMKSLHKVKDWPIERLLMEAERYNGWGYRMHHGDTLSPYVWSGTQHYTKGKYIADGQWSSSAVSQQVGVAAIIKRLSELDPTIKLYHDGDQSGPQPSV